MSEMHKRLFGPWVLVALLLNLQAGSNPQQEPILRKTPQAGIRVETRLVVVDVVVTDKKGVPVDDLGPQDFLVLEDGRPQKLVSFSFSRFDAADREPKPSLPPLPPNVFTNRPSYTQRPSVLTVFLLDVFNTQREYLPYVRQKLLEYLKSPAAAKQRIAILALGNGVWVLQDFTSDPALLRAALEAKRSERKVAPFGATTGAGSSIVSPAQDRYGAIAKFNEFLRQVDEDDLTQRLEIRAHHTLRALQEIAASLRGYAGPKNLIWISSGYPTLNPSNDVPLAVQREMRRTMQALSSARIVIYPVDARGLVGWSPALAASPIPSSGGKKIVVGWAAENLPNPKEVKSAHEAMAQLAAGTGGLRFINRNDLDKSISRAVKDSSVFYTLAYRPANKTLDGKFRRIQIKLSRKGLRGRHRTGYHAVAKDSESFDNQESWERAFQLSALHPAPPDGVTFLVQVGVLPPATAGRVQFNFLVDADSVLFEALPDAQYECGLDFLVLVYSLKGKYLKSNGFNTTGRLNQQQYESVLKDGLIFQETMKLDPGEYRLRVLVRDRRTGAFGRVDIPARVNPASTD